MASFHPHFPISLQQRILYLPRCRLFCRQHNLSSILKLCNNLPSVTSLGRTFSHLGTLKKIPSQGNPKLIKKVKNETKRIPKETRKLRLSEFLFLQQLSLRKLDGAPERTRTFTGEPPLEPESSASTNSATSAHCSVRTGEIIHDYYRLATLFLHMCHFYMSKPLKHAGEQEVDLRINKLFFFISVQAPDRFPAWVS